jgi:poly-beta-1,6-N-acetyl-D-glucosamine synthase
VDSAPITSTRYAIISPIRNEARHIEKTINSVAAQVVLPNEWIVVDDGSTDDSAKIVSIYAARFPWLHLLRLQDRGYYDLRRGGEIKAFYHGLDLVNLPDLDFLVKLDGDVSFESGYFSDLLREFSQDPRLGIASGACYYEQQGRMVLEKANELQPRGAARMYRLECWRDIGGVVRDLAWDVVDVYRARMQGWHTRAFRDIRMIHHVKTDSKGGVISGWRRQGRVEYLVGTHPLFFLLKAGAAILRNPFLVGSLCFLFGFLESRRAGEARVVDADLGRFIRNEQLRHLRELTLGRAAARWSGRAQKQ